MSTFSIRFLGTIGFVDDKRVYSDYRQIVIDHIDGNTTTIPMPYLQRFLFNKGVRIIVFLIRLSQNSKFETILFLMINSFKSIIALNLENNQNILILTYIFE